MGHRRPSAVIHSANIAAVDAIRAGVFPETTRVLITGSGCDDNRFGGRRLLDDHVCVGAADPEGRHPGPTRPPHRRPGHAVGRDGEPRSTLDSVRRQLGEVQMRRNVAVLHAEHGLDETGDPGGRLQMTQVGLHRPQHQRRRAVALTEDLTQRPQFDRITQRGAGAVRLDVVDLRRLQPRRRQRRTHHRLLGRPAGHRLPAAGTILVDRRTAHHRQHRIPVAQRIAESLEHHDAATLAADIAVRAGIKGFATSIGSQHSPPRGGDAVFRAQHQVDPGHQRLIAFPSAQALAGQMDGDQRRRARGVDHHGRAVRTQEIRQASGGEVRRVPERYVRVDLFRRQPSSQSQGVVIGGHADEDRGLGAANHRRGDARVFQCLPGDFEQQPLLRVHRCGLARGDPEELGVEFIGSPGGEEAPLSTADRPRHLWSSE